MAEKKEEKVVEAEAKNADEQKEQKSVTFPLGTLSVILSLVSIGLTLLFAIIGFFASITPAIYCVFLIITIGIAVFAAVLAWINSKQKISLSLALAAFVILLNVIIYF